MKTTEHAPAKLNLSLDILGKRADGYHELEMVMESITLHDTLTVESRETAGLVVETGRADLPNDERNLAARATRVFFERLGQEVPGLSITIEKRIPAGAGMAGGSSDAAATLRALRRLYCPSLSDEALEQMGALVGSDVPYCVRGGSALARGRGERLSALPPMPDCNIVVCKPNFAISTPALFARVKVGALPWHPDTADLVQTLKRGDLQALAGKVCNVFESVLPPEYGEIFVIKKRLLAAGALCAAMTGSGPTVFALFDQEAAARQAYELLAGEYAQTFLEKPL